VRPLVVASHTDASVVSNIMLIGTHALAQWCCVATQYREEGDVQRFHTHQLRTCCAGRCIRRSQAIWTP
jgi:hypothetical protein